MKLLGVVLVVLTSSACSGDPGETDDVVGSAEATSSLEILRGHGGRGDPGSGSPAIRRAIGGGAARLAALQADTIGDNARNGLDDTDPDDGGWDFLIAPSATGHTAAASHPNLFGEIGMGAWAAVDSGNAGTRALVVALDDGTGMQRDPEIDSPPDFVFGVLLAALADNPGFAELARERYDAKRAQAGGAAGLGTLIRDGRHARNEDGLIAYDLGWLTLGAAALDSAFPAAGYDADAATYAGIVVDDLTAASPRFDPDDATEGFYVIGLAWSQVASSWLDAHALFRQLRARLLDDQHASGAWGTSATRPADDLQSTALAVQTLAITGHATERTRRAARSAARWLVGEQAASGGWPDASNVELPLIDAEIVLALMLSQTDAGRDGVVPGSSFRSAPPATTDQAVHAAPLP